MLKCAGHQDRAHSSNGRIDGMPPPKACQSTVPKTVKQRRCPPLRCGVALSLGPWATPRGACAISFGHYNKVPSDPLNPKRPVGLPTAFDCSPVAQAAGMALIQPYPLALASVSDGGWNNSEQPQRQVWSTWHDPDLMPDESVRGEGGGGDGGWLVLVCLLMPMATAPCAARSKACCGARGCGTVQRF